MKPTPLDKKPKPVADSRWSKLGKMAVAAGFWFFLIKGLVWLALFSAAVFFGVEVVQAAPPPHH